MSAAADTAASTMTVVPAIHGIAAFNPVKQIGHMPPQARCGRNSNGQRMTKSSRTSFITRQITEPSLRAERDARSHFFGASSYDERHYAVQADGDEGGEARIHAAHPILEDESGRRSSEKSCQG